MSPAGIISSGGAAATGLAGAPATTVCVAATGATGAGVGKAGVAGDAAGPAVALLVAAGRRRFCVWLMVCARRPRPVKNKIRMSGVVFILPLRLWISNL